MKGGGVKVVKKIKKFYLIGVRKEDDIFWIIATVLQAVFFAMNRTSNFINIHGFQNANSINLNDYLIITPRGNSLHGQIVLLD